MHHYWVNNESNKVIVLFQKVTQYDSCSLIIVSIFEPGQGRLFHINYWIVQKNNTLDSYQLGMRAL